MSTSTYYLLLGTIKGGSTASTRLSTRAPWLQKFIGQVTVIVARYKINIKRPHLLFQNPDVNKQDWYILYRIFSFGVAMQWPCFNYLLPGGADFEWYWTICCNGSTLPAMTGWMPSKYLIYTVHSWDLIWNHSRKTCTLMKGWCQLGMGDCYMAKSPLNPKLSVHFMIQCESKGFWYGCKLKNVHNVCTIPARKTGRSAENIVACQAHPALVKQVSCWPVFWAHLCVCTVGSYASLCVWMWLDQKSLVKKSYLWNRLTYSYCHNLTLRECSV